MNTILDKRIIALTSKSGTHLNSSLKSNVSFQFTNLFNKDPSVAYAEMGVVSAEIPVSFYTINDTNNYMVVSLFSQVAQTTQTIVLSNGNYTATSFVVELKAKVQTAFASVNPTNLILLQTTFNRSNGKLSLSLPANSAVFPEIRLLDSPLRRLMGFSPTNDVELYQSADPIIADYPLNLLGVNKVYISSNNLLTYNYDSGKQGFSNILATLEVDAPPYSIILYKNTTNTFNILRNDDVNSFSIELKDDVGNYIDFNNIDWNITLSLNIYRYIVPSSTSKFSDVLGLGIKPPPKEEIKEPPKKEEPLIKTDLDLLTLPTKNNI